MKNSILEKILTSSEYVVSNALDVKINTKKIKELIKNYKFDNLQHWLTSNPGGILDLDVSEIVNFLIIYGSINCCYWGNPKWTIKTENGNMDGAFALIYALLALKKKKGHLDFTNISFEEFENTLKGNTEIPLLKERYQTLVSISKIINDKMKGNFYEFIKDIKKDKDLFNVIVNNFPTFKDERANNGETIYFYKLAQLLTSDILHIRKLKENLEIDCSNLVGCADYKIPQVLRGLGILEYSDTLSNIVDNKVLIPEGSSYEVEIRASMLVVIDLIKKELGNKVDAISINDFIWNIGQNKNLKLKPYHLTKTLSY